jgi:hypothetical protein
MRATITTFQQFALFFAHVKSKNYYPSVIAIMILVRMMSLSDDRDYPMIARQRRGR